MDGSKHGRLTQDGSEDEDEEERVDAALPEEPAEDGAVLVEEENSDAADEARENGGRDQEVEEFAEVDEAGVGGPH